MMWYLIILGIIIGILLIRIFFSDNRWKGPSPPIVSGPIPWVGAGLKFVANPKLFIEAQRKKHGDTFLVYMFGMKLFFVFSAEDLKTLYTLPENEASFSKATRVFLGLKVPNEIVDIAFKIDHCFREVMTQAFKRQLMDKYIDNAIKTITEEINRLPPEGSIEIISFMRKIVHKYAFRCWAGEEAALQYLSRFKNYFDIIDPEPAFVKPMSLISTILLKKREEKKALSEILTVLEEIWAERLKKGERIEDLYTNLNEALPNLLKDPTPEEVRKTSTYIMAAFHMASQTNLSSAAGWTLINVLLHENYKEQIIKSNTELKEKYGEKYLQSDCLTEMEMFEKVIYETIRLAQQSITLRLAQQPVTFTKGNLSYEVPKGYYIATILMVNNCSPEAVVNYPPTEFHPERYKKNRLEGCPAGKEFLVSTFGHGKHACPGERFSLNAIKVIITIMLERLNLKPAFSTVKIPETQLGAVARADRLCFVNYTKLK